ncbi:hypothetical protein [Bradyrhizobium brasilense]|uniref:hypothetical protein n=1 Tax=Bradyrhizobium brasilense TaxID=1419277 RepID=UPI001E529C88|nr:hypothetical protein [Bradyrhizobium brasilense]
MAEPKITLGEMRQSGARGLLVFCSDHRCSHSVELPPGKVDQWPDRVGLSDLEPHFTCMACGRRDADVRPHFAPARMGTR